MSPANAICSLTALEMARYLQRKELSAREVVDAHLDRIERVNPRVNAIVTLVADRALEQAAAADEASARGQSLGKLHGLPVAHKDLFDTAGIRTTYGSPLYSSQVPSSDALIVERMKRAGAIVIGKTNTPEFGAGSQTFNPVFGATRNPYDLSKTCGGSSGGSAVALACGMVPIADGTDMGGSLRNPASFCSVVGLRPSAGLIPQIGVAEAWNLLNVTGPMARTVGDLAFLLSAIAGPDPRCPLSVPAPGRNFGTPLHAEGRDVHLAWCSQIFGLPVDGDVRRVFEDQRKVFVDFGYEVTDAEPDLSGADEIFRVLRAHSFHQQHAALLAERGKVKATVIAEIEHGGRLTDAEVSRAIEMRQQLRDRVDRFLESYDAFVLPTVQVPPFGVEHPYVDEIDGVRMGDYIDWMRSCYYVTVTGLPAISVPAGFTMEGLPIGLQIVGRRQDDWSLLQIAHGYEQARELRVPLPASLA